MSLLVALGKIITLLVLLLPLLLLAILTGGCDNDFDAFRAWALGKNFDARFFSCFMASTESCSASGLLEGALFLL